MIDFFDFALVGYVLAFFVKDWHLTFGQSGTILFASGVASIPGAVGVVDVYAINSSVAVVKLAGKLPLEPGYLLHGN